MFQNPFRQLFQCRFLNSLFDVNVDTLRENLQSNILPQVRRGSLDRTQGLPRFQPLQTFILHGFLVWVWFQLVHLFVDLVPTRVHSGTDVPLHDWNGVNFPRNAVVVEIPLVEICVDQITDMTRLVANTLEVLPFHSFKRRH